MINSVRKYVVAGYELSGDEQIYHSFNYELGLDELLEEDLEVIYSLQDNFDEVLDLKVGEKFKTLADRSDKFSSATIIRIQ